MSRRMVAATLVIAGLVLGTVLGYQRTLTALTPDQNAGCVPAMLSASEDFRARTTTGDGVAFTVAHRTYLRSSDGQPTIAVADEDKPEASPTMVAEYFAREVLSRGLISPAGFWNEMREAATPGDAVDFATLAPLYAVIERDGLLWRRDGEGPWIQTGVGVGLGMDAVSAERLPGPLCNLANFADRGTNTVDGVDLRHFSGIADAVDYPGILVSDGLRFTSSPIPFDVWLDASGRMVRFVSAARNLNETEADLMSEVDVRFTYESLVDLPLP